MSDIELVSRLENIFNFKMHPIAYKYLNSKALTRLIIKGNQGGGTATAMYDAACRVLGIHTDKEKNKITKPVRFVSKILPQDHDDEQNQQFVEFRRLIPPELWAKKLTARSKVGKVNRLVGGSIDVEFMASTQDIDAFMSVQRGAYYQDEEIERLKWDENRKRLVKAMSDGEYADTTLSMTPVKGLDWSYDSLWRRAKRIFRSKWIHDHYGLPELEENKNVKSDIEIFCWATDDNPVLEKDAIENLFVEFDDPDELAMARAGIFRQVSGRIYKVFDDKIHVLNFDDVFNSSLFKRYWHFRVLDYHPSKPWYVTWVAVTKTHEWFVWNEMIATHDNKTIQDMRDDIKSESLLDEDDIFNRRTLIDPLAKISKVKSSPSVFDELSMGELGLRHCMSADTKDEKAGRSSRAHIKTRLKNSVTCQVPGNNYFPNDPPDIRYGHYKPTLWFLSNCQGHIEHFKSWRYIDFKQAHVKAVRTTKTESEKWSDFCRNIEFMGSLNPIYYEEIKQSDNWHQSKLYQGRRTA